MIAVKTRLMCLDNTGAILMKCIKILGTSNPKYTTLGNFIICALVKKDFNKFKQKKKIFLCFLLETKKNIKRRGNIYIKGTRNTVVLVNEEKKFFGTRTYGKTPVEFFRYKFGNFWYYVNGIY